MLLHQHVGKIEKAIDTWLSYYNVTNNVTGVYKQLFSDKVFFDKFVHMVEECSTAIDCIVKDIHDNNQSNTRDIHIWVLEKSREVYCEILSLIKCADKSLFITRGGYTEVAESLRLSFEMMCIGIMLLAKHLDIEVMHKCNIICRRVTESCDIDAINVKSKYNDIVNDHLSRMKS